MKNKSLIFQTILIGVAALSLASCNSSSAAVNPSSDSESSIPSESPSSESEEDVNYSPSNPRVVEYKEGMQGVELVSPYTIYDENGELAVLTTRDDGSAGTNIPNEYPDLYKAIRLAGNNSTSKKPLQVLDANFTQVFKRAKKSDNYLFQRRTFFGIAGQKSAKNFCLNNHASYAINGLGSDYYYLSRDNMVEQQTVTEEALETFAGAYNYMFSTSGDGKGFVYATADVHLSECVYKPCTDGGTWNAYIFINIAQGINVDLGLIGIYNAGTHVCSWKLVRNCSSTYHATGTSSIEKDARFYVYQDKISTESKNYNFETGECSGFDDLHFECLGNSWGWTLNVTNLRTGVTETAVDHHYDADHNDYTEDVNPFYGRALIAASYCPVILNVWNWDCGAKCEGVTWDNIYLKGVLSGEDRDNIEAYRDESLPKYELYPGCEYYRDGYSQGDYCSSHSFGVRESDGEYPSGIKYKAGDRYLVYNVKYNNDIY